MWKLPARYVGKYAEADARLTYDIYQYQIPILKDEDLWKVWELETELIPVLLHMTKVYQLTWTLQVLNEEQKQREANLRKQFSTLDIWCLRS